MSDTEIVVDEIPECDLRHITTVPAVYDAKSIAGPWLYLCEADFKLYGVGLGGGLGQKLVLRRENENG